MTFPVLRFHRVALGATFEIRLAGESSADYATEALESVWDALAHVAQELDASQSGSALDASHRMVAGERLRIPPHLRDCLDLAARLQRTTAGALDISVPQQAERPAWMEARAAAWRLEGSDLICDQPGWQFDLGDLARGHALDKMAEVLREWGLAKALITAGGGLALAVAAPDHAEGWKMAAGNTEFLLADGAMASFGGRSPAAVTDPRLGQRVLLPKPCRALAHSAAEAAGWARALAAATPAEVALWVGQEPAIGLWTADGQRLGTASRLALLNEPHS